MAGNGAGKLNGICDPYKYFRLFIVFVDNGKKLSKTELNQALKEQRLNDEKERIKNLKPKEKQTFYISGKFHVTTTYRWATKKGGPQFKEYKDI